MVFYTKTSLVECFDNWIAITCLQFSVRRLLFRNGVLFVGWLVDDPASKLHFSSFFFFLRSLLATTIFESVLREISSEIEIFMQDIHDESP